jgi:hypothetical protein
MHASVNSAADSGTRHCPPQDGTQVAQEFVGQDRARLSVLRRRVQFVARFIYWAIRHRSFANAAWVCNYEGLYW